MAQHDYVIANQSGASFRADLNNALAAIVSNNSGATAPSTTYAYQWWADTTAGQLKLRNGSNDGWIVIQELDGTMLMEDGTAASPGLAFASDLDTGFFRAGTNQLGIATNGTVRLTATTTAITSALPVDVLLGSASTPSYTFTGDLNTGIYSPGADQIAIATGGTGRLFVDGSGNVTVDTNTFYVDAANNRVGIGTTSATEKLTVDGGICARHTSDDSQIKLSHNGTIASISATYGSTGAYDPLAFFTSDTERARIDSSGRFLVGTTTSRTIAGDQASIQLETAGVSRASITTNAANTAGAFLNIAKSRGTSLNSKTVVVSGDDIGGVNFYGADGTNDIQAASITAAVDGTPGTNDMPGRIVLATTADGASSPSERMRIRSSGEVLVNSTALLDLAGQSFQVNGWSMFHQTSGGTTVSAFTHTASGTQSVCIFRQGNPATTVGSITVSGGTSTAFNTSSDYRLKENITLVTDGINRLQQLKPSRFNFIANPDNTVDGFIAHEVQEVVPEAITGEKDAVDDDGNPVYQGIDQSKLVPLLTAALQEAVAKIESLEARLTAAGI